MENMKKMMGTIAAALLSLSATATEEDMQQALNEWKQ